jgi:hypothetical protein
MLCYFRFQVQILIVCIDTKLLTILIYTPAVIITSTLRVVPVVVVSSILLMTPTFLLTFCKFNRITNFILSHLPNLLVAQFSGT